MGIDMGIGAANIQRPAITKVLAITEVLAITKVFAIV